MNIIIKIRYLLKDNLLDIKQIKKENYFAKSCNPLPIVLASPFAPSVIFPPSFCAPLLAFAPTSLAFPLIASPVLFAD